MLMSFLMICFVFTTFLPELTGRISSSSGLKLVETCKNVYYGKTPNKKAYRRKGGQKKVRQKMVCPCVPYK
jgi:hypothetical protein